MKAIILTLLLSVFALAQQPSPAFRVATTGMPCECPAPLPAVASSIAVPGVFLTTDMKPIPDECSREKLLSAIQKAAKQLLSQSGDPTGAMTLILTPGQYDKYAGKSYIERLHAIAADKEREAKEARDTANREEAREADIKLIKRLAKECLN